jgi:hypothetical protein
VGRDVVTVFDRGAVRSHQRIVVELSERGLSVVDPASLVVTFGPLADAAKSRLEEELERHHVAIAQAYGEDSLQAFRETTPLDSVVVLESLQAQRAAALEEELKSARETLAANARSRLGEQDKAELERLRAQARDRKRRGLSKKRGAQSSPKSRRKKK